MKQVEGGRRGGGRPVGGRDEDEEDDEGDDGNDEHDDTAEHTSVRMTGVEDYGYYVVDDDLVHENDVVIMIMMMMMMVMIVMLVIMLMMSLVMIMIMNTSDQVTKRQTCSPHCNVASSSAGQVEAGGRTA